MEQAALPPSILLSRAPDGALRLTTESTCYLSVKAVWSSPLSRPGKYLSILDGQGEEVAMIVDPGSLDAASLLAIQLDLDQRYLTSRITAVLGAKFDNGVTYWTVETHRGRREFLMQQVHENSQWLSPTHVMLTDVDGNRFEILDTRTLDAHGRQLVTQVL